MTRPSCLKCEVADWSQAKIGYTNVGIAAAARCVADWSQAKIGYTKSPIVKIIVQLRIGLRPRLVTLALRRGYPLLGLRIGLRPRLVTLPYAFLGTR